MFLSDPQFWSILLRSLWISGTAVGISTLIGLPLGVRLGLASRPVRRWAAVVWHTGMALPPVVVGLLLYLCLSRSGPLAFLEALFTPAAMIAAQVILGVPFVAGIAMEAVAAVPPELGEQVRCLGASPRQCRWTIVREARSGILLAIAAATGRSLSEVGAVLMVGGNIQGHTRVLTTAIVLETSKGNFELALGLGGALLLIALLVNLFLLHCQRGASWR